MFGCKRLGDKRGNTIRHQGLGLDTEQTLLSVPLLGGHDEAQSSAGGNSASINDFLRRLSEEYSES